MTVPKIDLGYRVRHKRHPEWCGILKTTIAEGGTLWCGIHWLEGDYKKGLLPYWNSAKDLEPDDTAWWLQSSEEEPNILYTDGKRVLCLGTKRSIVERGGIVEILSQWQGSLSLDKKPIDLSKLRRVNPRRVDPSDLVVDLTFSSNTYTDRKVSTGPVSYPSSWLSRVLRSLSHIRL